MKTSVAITMFIIIAAAGSPAAQAQQLRPVGVQDDRFSASATLMGSPDSVNPLGGTFRMWRLRTWVDKKTGEATHQLYVDTGYRGHWRFWELASTDKAEALNVSSINRSVTLIVHRVLEVTVERQARHACTMPAVVIVVVNAPSRIDRQRDG